jgi:ABC-2 type transport system ATP-binding protein
MTAPAALRCAGLTRCFGSITAIDRVSLTVPQGTVLALVGANGAGKSTLLHLMLGLQAPTNGTIDVFGQAVHRDNQRQQDRISYLSDDDSVDRGLRVQQFANYRGAINRRFDRACFDALAKRAGIRHEQRLGDLSRGQRTSLLIAAALANDPELLILDDPTVGLDASARRDVIEAIIATARRPGRTVIFSTHQVEDIDRVADRLAILDRGTLIADASLDEFRSAIRRTLLRFPSPPPQPGPGVLAWHVEGDVVEAITVIPDGDIDRWATSCGASSVQPLPLNLDAALTAYLTPHRTPLSTVIDQLPPTHTKNIP